MSKMLQQLRYLTHSPRLMLWLDKWKFNKIIRVILMLHMALGLRDRIALIPNLPQLHKFRLMIQMVPSFTTQSACKMVDRLLSL